MSNRETRAVKAMTPAQQDAWRAKNRRRIAFRAKARRQTAFFDTRLTDRFREELRRSP